MCSRSHPLQNQSAKTVDARVPAGRDHRGRIELLDDGGALDRAAAVEAVALIELGLDRGLIGEVNAAAALHPEVGRAPHPRPRRRAPLPIWPTHAPAPT